MLIFVYQRYVKLTCALVKGWQTVEDSGCESRGIKFYL